MMGPISEPIQGREAAGRNEGLGEIESLFGTENIQRVVELK